MVRRRLFLEQAQRFRAPDFEIRMLQKALSHAKKGLAREEINARQRFYFRERVREFEGRLEQLLLKR